MTKPSDVIAASAAALKERVEEVNRLNVFPVPDGDTGTNMSLTMQAVVGEVGRLSSGATLDELCKAVTHGSLMGARGNSGVILSQILRGLCEGLDGDEQMTAETIAKALRRSVVVAFQAVRKPVEGTMLTVIRDVSSAADESADQGMNASDALTHISEAAFESVRRTPELLPVLKENGVVDSGGFGLAILIEGFVAALHGTAPVVADVSVSQGSLTVLPVDDWDDTEYLYCTEFLLFGDDIDKEAVHDFIASIGGSELIVGDNGEYKVHVHTDDPGKVLGHMTSLGEVAEVHINNMRRQQAVRDAALRSELSTAPVSEPVVEKDVGFVAVASGRGLADILRSLGADVIVSGGQTMNPSTQDLLAAIESVPACRVVVFPDNKNIVMAANAAATVASKPTAVVPTTSVPAAFAALLAYEDGEDFDAVVASMNDAAASVKTAEVTTAVKDAKSDVGDITAGQVIGIIDGKGIQSIGTDVSAVAANLVDLLDDGEVETLTLLAGEQMSDEQLAELAGVIASAHPDLDVETHRGEQPLYPIIMAME